MADSILPALVDFASDARVAEDFARSEALGQAILDAQCEPLPYEAPKPSTFTTYIRKVNLVTQESWIEALSTAA